MVVEILSRIEATCSLDGMSSEDLPYIYRGENKHYDKVSSGLYRYYEAKDRRWEWMPEGLKEKALEKAIKHSSPFLSELSSDVQHLGGKTNWIDFTDHPVVALFFACLGEHEKDGRIIVAKESDLGRTHRPSGEHVHPRQSSVLVRPKCGGVISITPEIKEIRVHAKEKQGILTELDKRYGISFQSLYNTDIHRYIRFQGTSLLGIGYEEVERVERKCPVLNGDECKVQVKAPCIFISNDGGEKWHKIAGSLEIIEGFPSKPPVSDSVAFYMGNQRITAILEGCSHEILRRAQEDKKNVLVETRRCCEDKLMSDEETFLGSVESYSPCKVEFCFHWIRWKSGIPGNMMSQDYGVKCGDHGCGLYR